MEGAVNNEVEDLKENGTSIWSNKVFRIFLSKLYFFDRQFNGYTRFTAMGNEINKFTLTCFGVNIAIATAAILFAPVTGTLADRMSRRKLMIIADVMRCIVMILIAVIAFLIKCYTFRY